MSPDDVRAELAEITADLRTLLEDAILRGQIEDASSSVSPPVDPEVHRPPARAWAAIAEADRRAPSTPDEALRRIRADLGECRRCALCQGRRNIVFGVGDARADLVVVGEAPGQQEDARGEPFVGPAGEMLDKMLENVLGLSRSEVYICNVVKCRPPENRNPRPDEVAACLPFLEAQLLALQPKVILILGSVALKSLLGVEGIKRHRGRWTSWRDIPALPTFHPAYLLRQPEDKRLVFEDLKAVRTRYDALGGRRG